MADEQQDQLTALKAKMASDPAFRAELEGAKTREDAERVAAAHGFDVSKLSSQIDRMTATGELTDDELEMVAGGKGSPPPVKTSNTSGRGTCGDPKQCPNPHPSQ